MPKYKPKNCHCPNKKRLVSHGIARHTDCLDVCTNPICGTSDQLTLLAPVVYDEIGINLCRVIPLTATLPTTGYPLSASAQILDVTFSTEADETTTIEPIPGRPNCSLVTLTNLSVTFAITIYNSSCRIVQTLTETALYLPSGENVPAYEYFDEETNPSNVDLEIFTPYGLAYEDGNIEKPFVIGCVPMLSSSFVTGNTDEYNKNKVITSKNGNTIMLVDEEADEGANDKVIINSSNKNLNITLDNEKQCIELYDKEKKNSVQINSDTGTMKISVEKKLKLKVGDVELDINGESGNVSLKCSQLKLSADDSMKVVSQGICKLEAQNIAVNAGSSYKVSAGNSYVVESAIINLS